MVLHRPVELAVDYRKVAVTSDSKERDLERGKFRVRQGVQTRDRGGET